MQGSIPQVRLERLKVHSCTECEKVFISSERLESHLDWHHLERYLDKPGVLEHYQSAYVKLHVNNIFQCHTCPNAFINLKEFKKHLFKHKEQKKQISKQSDNGEGNNIELIKPYECEECGVRFVAESTLIAHSVVHEPMPYICHCGIGYYKKGDLNGHQRLVHPTKITWFPKTKYSGPKVKSEFAIKPEPEYEYSTKSKIAPKLRAELVIKKKKPKRDRNKENIKREKSDQLKINKCEICNKILSSKSDLKIHLRVHTGERPYQCTLCPKRFTQDGALKRHIEVHENLRQYKCSYCDKRFNHKTFVRRHELIHKGDKPYKCNVESCGKGFADPSALGRHMRIHTDDRRYNCEFCLKSYTDLSGYLQHKNRKHLFNKFPCKICGKNLASVYNLNIHMKIQHKIYKNGVEKQEYYECDYCGKRFKMKQHLNLHIQVVHVYREKVYKCDFCPKLFTHPLYRRSHMNVEHYKKYAFECDYCGEVFTKKDILTTHIKYKHITPKNVKKVN